MFLFVLLLGKAMASPEECIQFIMPESELSYTNPESLSEQLTNKILGEFDISETLPTKLPSAETYRPTPVVHQLFEPIAFIEFDDIVLQSFPVLNWQWRQVFALDGIETFTRGEITAPVVGTSMKRGPVSVRKFLSIINRLAAEEPAVIESLFQGHQKYHRYTIPSATEYIFALNKGGAVQGSGNGLIREIEHKKDGGWYQTVHTFLAGKGIIFNGQITQEMTYLSDRPFSDLESQAFRLNFSAVPGTTFFGSTTLKVSYPHSRTSFRLKRIIADEAKE